MADEAEYFDGFLVDDTKFETGGGGTPRPTKVRAKDGDTVGGTWSGKIVNVKHPMAKGGKVTRLQTVNIEEMAMTKLIAEYEPPAETEPLPLEGS